MDIDEVFRKLRPLMGSKLDLLWQEYIVADAAIRKEIERILRLELGQRLQETFESNHVLLKPPPREVATGDYPVGMIHYAKKEYYPFGIREDEFIQHVGIFGRSGSGKTNLAYLLVLDLVKAGKPFLVFDWKRNYRDLLSLPECKDMIVLTVGRNIAPFRFNPLFPPPGTQATVWLKKLIEVICHAYFLGEGVTVLLMRAIDSLYKRYGLYDNHPVRIPTMSEVRNFLLERKPKGREAGWMESAMRAVEVLCFGEMGHVLNSQQPLDIAGLLDKQVILELDALTNADKTFLIESLLLWIHHYRMAQEERETFKHAVIIEEAHHILLRKKQEATGEETVTDVILREIRELGEAIICIDQHPSLISKPALGNTYTTFAFNLKHRGDLAMMQDCLLLDSEQTDYLGRLEVGWAVAKLQGRWFWPFLIKLPLIEVNKGNVSDQIIQQRAKQSSTEPTDSEAISGGRADSGQDGTPDVSKIAIPQRDKNEGGENGNLCAIKLTTQDRKFLLDIYEHPTYSVTQHYSSAGLSARKGNEIQQALLNNCFLVAANASIDRKIIKILALTEKGREALGIRTQSAREGGVIHTYWKHRLAEHLKSCGYSVEQEMSIGEGKTIDIMAERDGKCIAFEIETGNSNTAANIKKCLNRGIDMVFVVATSQQTADALATILPEQSRVKLLTGHEAIEHADLSKYLK